MADTQDQILKQLASAPQLDSSLLQTELGLPHEALYAELVSLLALNYITLENKKVTRLILTPEGESYVAHGTPEARIFKLASLEGTPKELVEGELKDAFKIGFGNAMKKKIVVLKEGKVFRTKEEFADEDQAKLQQIRDGKGELLSKEDVKNLRGRKLVEEKQETTFIVRRGEDYRESKVELVPELTSAMLADNSWEALEFKKFNPASKGLEIENGNLHLLMKTKQQFVEILLEMGFEEMQTDRYVESSFWNFDSLFQPQAHPARDAHDTFFLAHPDNATVDDPAYFQAVKNIHEKGGFGSQGYDYEWDPKEAFKNLLRTHTTAVSSRVLKDLAKEQPFRPRKFFSIDRVFRNETLDNTHLAEFHQVEGFVVDRNLGLQHLIGILTEFYKKIGIEQIWFKPTYNPYTEPSMEVFGSPPPMQVSTPSSRRRSRWATPASSAPKCCGPWVSPRTCR